MGAVHGVYLKYVGLSAVSFAGFQLVMGNIGPMDPIPITSSDRPLMATSSDSGSSIMPLLRLSTASVLGYSTLLNGTIAVLFKLRRGMSLIGKDRQRGTIPMWSYALFFPFHIPTYAYTYVHTRCGTMTPYPKDHDGQSETPKQKLPKVPVPVASEVQPGWWVGGCYANELNKEWAAVIDLTVEFPEACRPHALRYLCLPTWDGVPCSPEQLEQAANLCVDAREEWARLREKGKVKGEPHILIHCAHGRGRSTTVMCAALVKMGMFANYEDALEKGIRPGRPVCKLNKMMRANLAEWQKIYIDGKKGV